MILDTLITGCNRAPAPLVYERVAAPAGAVLDQARVCAHLRIDAADLDVAEAMLLEASIAAATEHVDGRAGILNKALLTQTWQATTNRPSVVVEFRIGFVLDFGPVQAVTKVERRLAGDYVALSAGQFESFALRGGRIAVLLQGDLAADIHPAAWRITFRAGYGDAGDTVPAPIRSAILLMIADLFDNRDGKVQANLVENPTVDRLLAPYRAVGV